MTEKDLYQALPFLAAIAFKLLDRYYAKSIGDQIARDIPYRLEEEQAQQPAIGQPANAKLQQDRKYTVADIAGDAHLRTTYMLTLCLSVVSTAALTGTSGSSMTGLLMVVSLGMIIATSFPILTKKLGWMNVHLQQSKLRRSDLAMILLILIDVALMIFTLSTT